MFIRSEDGQIHNLSAYKTIRVVDATAETSDTKYGTSVKDGPQLWAVKADTVLLTSPKTTEAEAVSILDKIFKACSGTLDLSAP